MRKIVMVSAIAIGTCSPHLAAAAIGNPASYAPDEVAIAGLVDSLPASSSTSNTVAEICIPPEEQYIPSFVRDARGHIVGVTYTIIEYVC